MFDYLGVFLLLAVVILFGWLTRRVRRAERSDVHRADAALAQPLLHLRERLTGRQVERDVDLLREDSEFVARYEISRNNFV